MKLLLLMGIPCMTLFGLTLEKSIDLSLEHSPLIALHSSDVRYQQILKDEATAGYQPTLDAEFGWQKLEKTSDFIFSPTHHSDIYLSYNLFNGFSDYANIRSKEADVKVSRLLRTSAVSDLKLSVTVAYANIMKAQKSIQVQTEQLKALSKQYDDTQNRYEQGVVAKDDLLLIEVEKLKAEQSLIQAKSDLRVTKNILESNIGLKLPKEEPLYDFNTSISQIQHMNILEEQMLSNRSEIKASTYKKESLLRQRDAANGSFLPKIDTKLMYQVNDQERSVGSSLIQPKDQTSVNINLSWNLYNGHRDELKRKSLLEKSFQEDYQLNLLKFTLKEQLIRGYENYVISDSAKKVAVKALKSAIENYRITSDKFAYGKIDTLTLLVSQSNLTQAKMALNNAEYDLYIAYRTIERIVGE